MKCPVFNACTTDWLTKTCCQCRGNVCTCNKADQNIHSVLATLHSQANEDTVMSSPNCYLIRTLQVCSVQNPTLNNAPFWKCFSFSTHKFEDKSWASGALCMWQSKTDLEINKVVAA